MALSVVAFIVRIAFIPLPVADFMAVSVVAFIVRITFIALPVVDCIALSVVAAFMVRITFVPPGDVVWVWAWVRIIRFRRIPEAFFAEEPVGRTFFPEVDWPLFAEEPFGLEVEVPLVARPVEAGLFPPGLFCCSPQVATECRSEDVGLMAVGLFAIGDAMSTQEEGRVCRGPESRAV
jgi:hypothetical protein